MATSKYIDIGANLTSGRLLPTLGPILEDSRQNGVDIIITGTTVRNSEESLEIVQQNPSFRLWSTAGIHPHDANTLNASSIDKLRALLSCPMVVAVGECGLDFNRLYSPKERQIEAFRAQLDLALAIGKPVFLHEREAFDDFVQILSEPRYTGAIRGVVHCFTGTVAEARKYVEMGLYIGFTGFICDDKRNKNTLLAIREIPLDKIMVETDSPFMLPIKGRGPNVPTNVRHVVDRLAISLNLPHDVMAQICYENTIRFFNILR